jgi:hypothetical protein
LVFNNFWGEKSLYFQEMEGFVIQSSRVAEAGKRYFVVNFRQISLKNMR